MICNECGTEMRRLAPRPVYDPQPTRYEHFYVCDERECPAQGVEVQEQYCITCGAVLQVLGLVRCAQCFETALFYCDMTDNGYCMSAGSEYCDFECPFRRWQEEEE